MNTQLNWFATAGADMVIRVVPADEIALNARLAADAGLGLDACPYPVGSKHARSWHIHWHARQLDLRGEVEG
jgi:hypothetical protein